MSQSQRNRHVVPHGMGWVVRRAGSKRLTSLHRTEGAAVAAASRTAQKERCKVTIHDHTHPSVSVRVVSPPSMMKKMADFSVEVEVLSKDAASLSVKGSMDANAFAEFDQSLQRLFGCSTYKILINFSNLDYISCAGIGVLIGALPVVREYKGEIVLVGLKENTKEVFELLSIDRMFKITNDTNEALKILR